MSDPGAELRNNNERIIEFLLTLKAQRNELQMIIEKQEEEKRRLQHEIERITYKLNLMAKSLAQRLAARDKYDQTIKEAEENYQRIVECSGILLNSVQKEYGVLSEAIDKRVGTEADDFKLYDDIQVKVMERTQKVIDPTPSVAAPIAVQPKPPAKAMVTTVTATAATGDTISVTSKQKTADQESESVVRTSEPYIKETIPFDLAPRREMNPELLAKMKAHHTSEDDEDDDPYERKNRGTTDSEDEQPPPKTVEIIRTSEEKNAKTLYQKAMSKIMKTMEKKNVTEQKIVPKQSLTINIPMYDEQENLLEVAPDVKFFEKKDSVPFIVEDETSSEGSVQKTKIKIG